MRFLFLCLIPLLFCACRQEEDPYVGGLGFDEFVPVYNRYIDQWLTDQIAENEKELSEAEAGSIQAKDAEKLIDRFTRRKQLKEYFRFAEITDLPADLQWKDGEEEPEHADPAAKKGGVFRYAIGQYPPNFRPFGLAANHAFRSNLYDDIEIGLLSMNAMSGKVIPGVATHWAASEDQRTYYFRLDENATYNDGVPVKARDFAVGIYLRVSDYARDTFFSQYYRENLAQITIYDDRHLALTMPEPKSDLGMYSSVGGISPSPPHFYEEFGPDYNERYNWRIQPTTGAYFVKPEDIDKGVSVTLTRKKDWWGNQRKFYRYRFNPDQIVWTVVRDTPKIFELFRAGQFDMTFVSSPQQWYEKSEIEQVYKGYVERHWWYNQFPRPQWGILTNLSKKKLQDINLRKGLAHSLAWDKAINVIFWGDYARLQGFVDGYGEFVNENVKPWPYSIEKARAFYAKAGYTEEGNDGILRKPSGERLELELTYGNSNPDLVKLVTILKNEARSAGLDLILDGKNISQAFADGQNKKHELIMMAWSVQPPYFAFYEYFHSRNAYDEKGNPKPKTNNFFAYGNPEVDRWCEEYRATGDEEVKLDLAWKIQQKVYEDYVFVPGWKRDFQRIACWRWLRWPNSETVKFCAPIVSYPYEHYSFWIDQEMKEETLNAIRNGETFPEVENIVEEYRTQ